MMYLEKTDYASIPDDALAAAVMAERTKKLVEALKAIATGRDADGAKLDFFQDIAAEALRKYQEHRSKK